MSVDLATEPIMVPPAFDRFSIWGTSVVLGVTRPEALGAARARLDEVLEAVEQAASRFRPESEIHSVNAYAGRGRIMISSTLFDLITVALWAAEATGGACDPTIADALISLGYDRDFDALEGHARRAPSAPLPAPGIGGIVLDASDSTLSLPRGVHLDLGATAKARAVDLAAERIAASLGTGVLVDVGGDLRVAGQAPKDGWAIGITKSARTDGIDEVDEVVSLGDGAMASSSSEVRTWDQAGLQRHHVVDPRTGSSAETPFSMITVVAASCVEANAASTAGLVWGEDALFEIAQRGLPARLVRRTGAVERIGGWPAEHDEEGAG
jgi:thiamine biosynthesis lipoprotein